jgi:hypothetical protein
VGSNPTLPGENFLCRARQGTTGSSLIPDSFEAKSGIPAKYGLTTKSCDYGYIMQQYKNKFGKIFISKGVYDTLK